MLAGATCPYDFGPAIVGVDYSNVQYRSGADSLFKGHDTFNIAGVFGQWTIRPAVQLFAGYSYTRGGEVDGVDERAQYHNVTLGAQYNLSKRTDIYTSYAKQINQGNAVNVITDASNAGLDTVGTATANILPGFNPWSAQIGIRHKF